LTVNVRQTAYAIFARVVSLIGAIPPRICKRRFRPKVGATFLSREKKGVRLYLYATRVSRPL